MDTHKHMIIASDKFITKDVRLCSYNQKTQKYDLQFYTGKTYSYNPQNILWMQNPKMLNPKLCQISHEGYVFSRISGIYVFEGKGQRYWHICFDDGNEADYREKQLDIAKSCLSDAVSRNVFEYLKQIASLSDLRGDDGKKLLENQYGKVDFISKDTALADYLKPKKEYRSGNSSIPIFPFGCNQSQYKAVKEALDNSVSVIQGPPGTGKTQTILNIIANILVNGKTVQVVSNNNSATDNVLEKLSSSKYNMGFIVASLGKADNKKAFIAGQTEQYPDISSWKREEKDSVSLENIQEKSELLGKVFEKQEKLALLKQELAELELELKYFEQYSEETEADIQTVKIRKDLSSAQFMHLWQECQDIADQERKVSLLFKLRGLFCYGISDWKFYKQEISKMLTTIQGGFYQVKLKELQDNIRQIEAELAEKAGSLVDDVCEMSMHYLRDKLYQKYGTKKERKRFTEIDLWKYPYAVLAEYPIVLSTTFSSRSSLGKDVIYDYLIMDEASQVDVATGALALSCARNVVIVGDTSQLPNVMTDDIKKRANLIFESFNLPAGYDYAKNSFLQSVLEVLPEAPQTLLREHYRCHPKIIHFCNQKFYQGKLVIMTQDEGEEDVLSVIRTVEGNHERNHYNKRQIDVIAEEVLPDITADFSEIGIIAPYNNQVNAIKKELTQTEREAIDVATVHKFQGREKDTIIISTVDDEITDFADDPYMLNVAVSRAKKQLYVVTSGNKQPADRNICDLIDYIEYNNFEVRNSQIYSVFDYLYKQYTKSRLAYLKEHKRVSEYDSENLMYALITDVLQERRYEILDVVCHQPLNMLIRNPELLDARECAYAMNSATHLDFLLYNRIGKKPVLAIEVDGFHYHQDGTVQKERDKMKNHILELYHIPLLRFSTNGSGEKEKLIAKLDELL